MAKPANTAAMTPFLFDRTFDRFDSENGAKGKAAQDKAAEEAEKEPEAPPEPPPVTFGEDEMSTARQESYMEGHADGFREGHAEAMDTLEGRLNELLELMAPMVADLGEVQKHANDRAQANMARIVQALSAKLMPVYMKKHGADEAVAVIEECLVEMQDPGRLMVYLSEETTELLGDRLNKVAEKAGFEGDVRIQVDDTLGPSDVRIDWGAGGAQRNYESIRAEVDQFIDQAVARIEEELNQEIAPITGEEPAASTQEGAPQSNASGPNTEGPEPSVDEDTAAETDMSPDIDPKPAEEQ